VHLTCSNWGDTIIPESWQNCPGECFQMLAPYRVSFGVVLYHAFFCLFTIGITTGMWYRARFHNGYGGTRRVNAGAAAWRVDASNPAACVTRARRRFWPIKLVMFVGLITAGFYVPDDFFQAYGYICIVLGIGFLIFQAIIMVDFAYVWAEVRLARSAGAVQQQDRTVYRQSFDST